MTGGHVHIAHLSTPARSRRARGQGARRAVTCEVAPHHFTLTDERLRAPVAYDTNTKMNPPLREAADRDALIDGHARRHAST